MTKFDLQFEMALGRCEFGAASDVRDAIRGNPELDLKRIARYSRSESALRFASASVLGGMGRAVAACLPDSFDVARDLLFSPKSKCIFEAQFSFFGALDPENFNQLEKDGIELLLVEYLSRVRSTESYAAWKAGMVLGEEWRSSRSELELRWLMKSARFPAGRLGAINGFRFIIQKRRTFTADELLPLRSLARSDKSRAVRKLARFHMDRLMELRNGAGVPRQNAIRAKNG